MMIIKRNAPPPNIVFCVLDAQRRDRFGIYGCERGLTPNLDDWSARSVVYKNAIAPAQWTIPSHASMFTGEFPTTHRTVQSANALTKDLPTLALRLNQAGYHTVGICNNPLIGLLDNGLRRGFRRFYNYGGAFQVTPRTLRWHAGRLGHIWAHLMKPIRTIADRIQNAVAQSDRVLQFWLNPALVPIWTRYFSFKGYTARSLQDTVRFLKQRRTLRPRKPFFLFMNMMETHLPYHPPKEWERRYAPLVAEDKAARDFVRSYNTRARDWLLPMAEPFTPLQSAALNGMYDAETAYQDHCFAELLELLDKPEFQENTAVIFVADHGEMLGEHQFMGHGLGVHQELVHVPLMIRYPSQSNGKRVPEPISTAQLFHTTLDIANALDAEESTAFPNLVGPDLSLQQPVPASLIPWSEAYAPDNVISILERQQPELIDRFHARATYRAAYAGPQKLVEIESGPAAVYDLQTDQEENKPHAPNANSEWLQQRLNQLVDNAEARQRGEAGLSDADEERIQARLRGLGYIE